jgi:ribosomal subunit interface protein
MVTNPNPDVSIDVTSRHQHVSEKTRAYAADKASKLLRFHNRISRIEIVMDRHKDDREVEIIVHVDSGHTFVARETANGFRAAFDPLISKMERQLKKDNQRRKNHKGAPGHKDQVLPDQPTGGGDDESYDDVVRRNLGT